MASTKTAPTRSRTRPRGEHASPGDAVPTARRRAQHADVETTDGFRIFLNQIGRYPLLTAPEEIELAKRIERGDLEAKERMINSNLRLVVSIARKHQGFGLPIQDLVQEAIPGLVRAAEKFDWRRGYKFSTYATLWIRQSIQRALDNTGREIRVPAHVAQQLRKVNRTESALATELDREPTEEEIAARAELPLEEVEALRDLARVSASLDQPVGESETTLGELRADRAPAVEDEAMDNAREYAVASALDLLPGLEGRVLRRRFGTAGEPEASVREIASELGVTQKKVRELERSGMTRLADSDALSEWRAAA